MQDVTKSIYPYKSICVITKKHPLSTAVIVAKIMDRVVIFDALSERIIGKNIITYVGRSLGEKELQSKFIHVIGKLITKDVYSKYFFCGQDEIPIPHLSNGEGIKELTKIEIDQIERIVDEIRSNEVVQEAINKILC